MPNTIERDASNRLWNRILTGVGLAGIAVTAAGTAFVAPDIAKANKAFREQTSADREVLEKYAPQVKNGEALTAEQGVQLIQQEHDNSPKDGKISITEAIDVLNRVKRYEGRTYPGWNESSKNLFQALMKIDKEQTK